MTTLGIIIGSTRPGAVGPQVARWAQETASATPGLQVDIVDLAVLKLPFLDEPVDASSSTDYQHQHTQDWSERVAAMDAVLLITPEYNSSFSAPLKNALDFLYREWQRKPVGFIGYGMTSAGTRAVAAMAPVVAALGMVPAGSVFLPLRDRVVDGRLSPTEGNTAALAGLVDTLLVLAQALGPVRV
jgi:NAD(P)H-dependent FMN reductase